MEYRGLNFFVTGGCGTLGQALAKRRKEEEWSGKMTIYSTDPHKHEKMRREHPDIKFIQGDIRDTENVYRSMVGHDVVIHAAAVKIIPVSEFYCWGTYEVNVDGSQSVCSAAIQAGIKDVVAISTDKACHPANAYGCSKMMMERLIQEMVRHETETNFHLVRFGNVLESNGSVIQVWKDAHAKGEPIKITDPEMTRFWLSPAQAVEVVLNSLGFISGDIIIPSMKATSISELATYVIGDDVGEMVIVPVRPGEKKHETLLTEEEGWYAYKISGSYFVLNPNIGKRFPTPIPPYTSDKVDRMTKEELLNLLNG